MVENEEIVELLRGGSVATNLLGAFGLSLKETRLTAFLGYLLALKSEPLMSLFGFRGNPQSIKLETRHQDGRSDIIVETNAGIGVIEAKVDATDATVQANRYPGRWRAVLTLAPGRPKRDVRYVQWQTLADKLGSMSGTANPEYRFLVKQFTMYLKEHHMIKKKESLEIYAREINEPVTLSLFMQGRIYGCKYEANNKLSRADYFAPHFGKNLARKQPGIFQGISYIGRIEEVIYAENWIEFKNGICAKRSKTWWNSHEPLMKELRDVKSWRWTHTTPRNFLLLGEPRLAFNPPVRKERLQKGKGWLSRRFFSFDDLFAAWGH